MPEISVVTPTYERADVLPRAIESVKAQTVEDYEHVVVDDGSTDGTPEVVADHQDGRIEYVRLEDNRGFPAATNRGIRAASGEYVSFLDSDDAYLPERLEVTRNALAEQPTRVGGVFHAYHRVSERWTPDHSVPEREIGLEDQADRNVVRGNSNTMYRARVFDAVDGFDEALQSSVEYDFQLRVLESFSMVGIDEPLCRKYDAVDGIQDDPAKKYQGLKRVLEKHGDVLTAENRARRRQQLGAACLELGEREEAREQFEQALECCPASSRATIHFKAGEAYILAGADRQARRHLARCVRADPADYRYYGLYGAALLPVDGARVLERLADLHDAVLGRSTREPAGAGSVEGGS